MSSSVMIAIMSTVILSGASVVIPFAGIYLITRKTEVSILSSFGLGLLAYFWSQYLLPIPLLYIITKIPGFMTIYNEDKWYVLYLLVTAIVLVSLATLARVWCVWLMNKRTPSLYRAASSAIGFSAFRAVSVFATYLSYYNYGRTYNAEGREALVKLITAPGNVTGDNANKMIDSLLGARAFDAAMEGINVVLMLVVEIALVVIIYEGFIQKKTVKYSIVSGVIGFVYSFAGMLINALAGDELSNLVPGTTCSLIYDAYLLACALPAMWMIISAFKKYKRALAEGPYAQKAYFERNNQLSGDKKDEDKIKQVL